MNTISHRIFSVLAVGLMCLSLVACQGDQTVHPTLAPNATSAITVNSSDPEGDQLEATLDQLEQGLNDFDTLGDLPGQ